MNPSYIAVGMELLDRLIAWKAMQDSGEPITDAQVDAFVADDDERRGGLVAAIAKARAEGR